MFSLARETDPTTVYHKLHHSILLLLCLINHITSFLPLFLKVFPRLFDFFSLFCDPHLKFLSLPFIGPWWELLCFIHLSDVLMFRLFLVLDCFLSQLEKLWVLVHVKVFLVDFAWEFLEWVSFKDVASTAFLFMFFLFLLRNFFNFELSQV